MKDIITKQQQQLILAIRRKAWYTLNVIANDEYGLQIFCVQKWAPLYWSNLIPCYLAMTEAVPLLLEVGYDI